MIPLVHLRRTASPAVLPLTRRFRMLPLSSTSRPSFQENDMTDARVTLPLNLSEPFVEYEIYGVKQRSNVKASFPKSATKLIAALAPLLSISGISRTDLFCFGTRNWQIGSPGSTIRRYFAFNKDSEANLFLSRVREAADDMNHHPEVFKADRGTEPEALLYHVAVACGTHRPLGLSMRDVRLAQKINEIAQPMKCMAVSSELAHTVDAATAMISARREEAVEALLLQRELALAPS